MRNMQIKTVARQASIVSFGVLFPVYVLFQAYQGIAALKDDVAYKTSAADLINEFSSFRDNISNANDYALFSLMYPIPSKLSAAFFLTLINNVCSCLNAPLVRDTVYCAN